MASALRCWRLEWMNVVWGPPALWIWGAGCFGGIGSGWLGWSGASTPWRRGTPMGAHCQGLGCNREHLIADIGAQRTPIAVGFWACFFVNQEQLVLTGTSRTWCFMNSCLSHVPYFKLIIYSNGNVSFVVHFYLCGETKWCGTVTVKHIGIDNSFCLWR